MELQPEMADAPDFALARPSCPTPGFDLVMTEQMFDFNVGSAGTIWSTCFARHERSWG